MTPEKVSGIGFIGATEIDSSPFQAHIARTIIISSDRGITHSAALNFQNAINRLIPTGRVIARGHLL